MAGFAPIIIPTAMKHESAQLYYTSTFTHACHILESGAAKSDISWISSKPDLRDVATNMNDVVVNGRMVDDKTIMFNLKYLVESSLKCPDHKTRPRTYDELREYPDIYVCESLVTQLFADNALDDDVRDLEGGYTRLPRSFVEAVRSGKSILFPINHRLGITTTYKDPATGEPLSCASGAAHWTLVFAHHRPEGSYDFYHYDSLPEESALMYAFITVHAMLDSVVQTQVGSPVVVSSLHCSFADKPSRWPFSNVLDIRDVHATRNMQPQQSGTSCGLYVIAYGFLLAIMRSPLKNSAIEQVNESFVAQFAQYMLKLTATLLVAHT